MGGRAHPDAYDFVVVLGDMSPAVVGLAVLSEAVLVPLPLGGHRRPAAAIREALAGGEVDTVPIARVAVDGDVRFTTDAVTVVADVDIVVEVAAGDSRRRLTVVRCQVAPVFHGTGRLALTLPPDRESTMGDSVEVAGGRGGLRVDFEGRSRRPLHLEVEAVPQGLHRLRIAGP